MKKILAVLLCVFALANLTSQAQAALITDWSYEIRTNLTIDPYNDYASKGDNPQQKQILFAGGGNDLSLTTTYTEGTLSSTGSVSDNAIEVVNNKVPSTGDGSHSGFARWSFSYKIYPTGDKSKLFDMNYIIDFNVLYFDDKMYLYYIKGFEGGNNEKVITLDGIDYNFSIDIANTQFFDFENTPNAYGWLFTGEETDPLSLQTSISLSYTAPTPEPSTMLLMGLGLAGLGFVARRRNK